MGSGLLSLGLLGIMVMRNEASRSSARQRMTATDIVTGNPANDRTSDAPFGEGRRRGSDDCYKRDG